MYINIIIYSSKLHVVAFNPISFIHPIIIYVISIIYK